MSNKSFSHLVKQAEGYLLQCKILISTCLIALKIQVGFVPFTELLCWLVKHTRGFLKDLSVIFTLKKGSSNINHGQNKRGPNCTRYSLIHAIGNYKSSRNFSNLHVSEIFVSPVSFSFDGLHISINFWIIILVHYWSLNITWNGPLKISALQSTGKLFLLIFLSKLTTTFPL